MTTVVDLKLKDLVPSPFNHRKVFPDLEQLAESIKARGVLQPITVRPLAKGWEIVFGERRWRASKLAGVETIPAIERKMTDVEVLEAQLIENVQRADVHPLEEADGYKELLEKHKYTVEQLVAKTGKSRAYIYARLKLCDLTPVPRKAFLAGELNPSVALMIARIPDVGLQAQATKEVLGQGSWGDYEGVRTAEINDDNGKHTREPLSVRAAQLHLTRKYTLRLDQAPFDTADATLLPKAGACTTCSYRTGNQPELFSDVKSADVCTRPSCFDDKKKADWDRKAAIAAKSGQRVLGPKETKNVFEQYGDGTRIQHGSAYVDPSDRLPYELDRTQKKTWKSLLGKAQPATVLALDGAGQARVLLDKKSAIATLTKTGKLKEVAAESKAARVPNAYRDQERKRQVESKRRHKVARLAFAEIERKANAEASKAVDNIKLWSWLALAVLRMMDSEDQRNLCKRRELETKLGSGDAEKALAKVVAEAAAAKSYARLVALIVEFAAAFRAVGGLWGGKQFGKNFEEACGVLGIDLAKLKTQVVAEEKAKSKAKR